MRSSLNRNPTWVTRRELTRYHGGEAQALSRDLRMLQPMFDCLFDDDGPDDSRRGLFTPHAATHSASRIQLDACFNARRPALVDRASDEDPTSSNITCTRKTEDSSRSALSMCSFGSAQRVSAGRLWITRTCLFLNSDSQCSPRITELLASVRCLVPAQSNFQSSKKHCHKAELETGLAPSAGRRDGDKADAD